MQLPSRGTDPLPSCWRTARRLRSFVASGSSASRRRRGRWCWMHGLRL